MIAVSTSLDVRRRPAKPDEAASRMRALEAPQASPGRQAKALDQRKVLVRPTSNPP